MEALIAWCEAQPDEIIAFEVLDPDRGCGRYAGSIVTCGNEAYRYRSYRAWNDLAEMLGRRMLTPRLCSDCTVELRLQRLESAAFHHEEADNISEKYGRDSTYYRIEKAEEPAFFAGFRRALQRVDVENRRRILDLGIHRGDEFAQIRSRVGETRFMAQHCVGIDHSATALEDAARRFGSNVQLIRHDINALDTLALGRFDLLISIGTLQSPGIDYKPLLMHLVRHYLTEEGAIILGFPNCRWRDGEMLYGAKAPNYPFAEQSLLYNDVMFAKKYLQQHKFRVTLTGKPYLFLSATRIGQKRPLVK